MKSMKRMVVQILTVILLVTMLAGCGSSKTEDGSKKTCSCRYEVCMKLNTALVINIYNFVMKAKMQLLSQLLLISLFVFPTWRACPINVSNILQEWKSCSRQA
jgi:hypothetical protein